MGTLDRTINHRNPSKSVNEPQAHVAPEEAKKNIQTITQNATPLGKVLEFLEKDLEAMKEEYEKWDEVEKEAGRELGKWASLRGRVNRSFEGKGAGIGVAGFEGEEQGNRGTGE